MGLTAEQLRASLDALASQEPAFAAALARVAPEHRPRWATVVSSGWTPEQATEGNGAVWPTLGSAVWALRRARSYPEVLRLVIDLGGDTDTIAAVAGGLAGAVHGVAGIPMRWTSAVHGRVPGWSDRLWQLADLHHLAAALDGSTGGPYEAPQTSRLEPREVADGVWAADLDGARTSSPEFAVVSLCRTGSRFPHAVQRFAYLTDDDANSELDAVLTDVLEDMAALRAEGRPVLVHCFAGQSRTGLVLRAWLRRTEGMSAAEATAHVRGRWPHLSEWNADFTAALERVR